MTNDTELNPNHYSDLADVAEMYSVSTATLRRRWKAGKFPKPIILFGKNKFKNSDLLEYDAKIQNEEPA